MQATDTFLLTVIFDETYGSLIEDFADKVSDPTHPWYGCYMAREELEAYVRPSDQARAAVDQWLAGYGITPASAQTANVQVRFYVGTRAQIEAAFGSHAARWLDPTIETRADRREWPIPRPIAGLVAQIQVLRGGDGSLEWLDGTYWLQSTAYGVEADSDEKPAGLAGLSPADIAEIYEVPQAYSGQGETIAVLMLSHSPAESDLRRFWAGQGIERCPKSADGLPEPLVNIVPIGPQPAQAEGLGALESAMVVEWAGAMAPGARLVVYVIDERTVADPWASFLLAVVGDKKHRPTIACTTWLLPERHYYNTHGARVITGLLNQCAALGITVVSATGDWGCFDSFPRTKDAESQTVADAPWPHAVFPAVEDKVLAVGGTMIPQRSPLTEVAWSGALPVSLYNRLAFTSFAGGGGFSMEVPIPSWQRPYLLRLPQLADRRAFSRGPDVPAVLAYGRGIPDVALVSTTRGVMTPIPEDQQVSGRQQDVTTQGYQALVQGTWIDYAGGTSLAAPVWSALLARINEARAQVMAPEKAKAIERLQTRMHELATSPDVSIRPDRPGFIPEEDIPDDHPALRRPVGFINPLLYRVHFQEANPSAGGPAPAPEARAFRDVPSGNTDVQVRTLQRNHTGSFKAFVRRIAGYEADNGWDPVTGLGVPRTGRLLERLVEPTSLGLVTAEPLDPTGGMAALLAALQRPPSDGSAG